MRHRNSRRPGRQFNIDRLEERCVLSASPIAGSSIQHFQSVESAAQVVDVHVTSLSSSSDQGAPVATGLTTLQFDEQNGLYRLSLLEAFSDPDAANTDLVFAIAGNTGDAVFDAIAIDATTGELVIDFIADATGSQSLTLTATDANGNTAATEFQVDVEGHNEVPNLIEFTLIEDEYGNFTFSGQLDLEGQDANDWTIQFGGDLDASTTVNNDGTFSHSVPEEEMSANGGVVSAQGQNSSGETTDLAWVDY